MIERIPDEPRNVEGRGMLFEGRADLALADEGGLVLACDEERLIVSIGEPSIELVRAAEARAGTGWVFLAPPEDPRLTVFLHGWRWEQAVVHEPPASFPALSDAGVVRPLTATDPLGHVDAELREELERVRRRLPVFAAFVRDRAVSFAYAPCRTERWFDVSVDTDVEHRGRGLAARCALALFADEGRHGRRAVWGALASNRPSLAVARRLGFTPRDRLIVFTREADFP